MNLKRIKKITDAEITSIDALIDAVQEIDKGEVEAKINGIDYKLEVDNDKGKVKFTDVTNSKVLLDKEWDENDVLELWLISQYSKLYKLIE